MTDDDVVRVAAAEEWPAVRAVRLRALGTDPAAFGSTLARELEFDDDTWRERVAVGRTFLAHAGEGVVGIAAFYVEEGHPDERQLVSMWVAPHARGEGLGAALVRAVIAAAAAEGVRAVTLFVADGNEGARRFYERLGFRSTGERDVLASNPSVTQERFTIALA